jgi:hypothetical protein
MTHYYGAHEEVIFKSEFKKAKKLSNIVAWIECRTDHRTATNPPQSIFAIDLHLKRVNDYYDDIEILESVQYIKTHLIVNGEDYPKNYVTEYIWENDGDRDFILNHFYAQNYDISTKEKRTITVSAYLENSVYDFGEINWTFELPEAPLPATLTIPSTIEAGKPFSVTVNPTLGFCKYYITYRPSDTGREYRRDISNYKDSRTLYVCNNFTLDPDRDGNTNLYKKLLFPGKYYPKIETETKITLDFECETWDDNYDYSFIGTTSQTVELVIPESVKPVAEGIVSAPMNPSCISFYDLANDYIYDCESAKAIGYVKGLCKARLFIILDSNMADGGRTASTLESYKVWTVNPDGSQTIITDAKFKRDPDSYGYDRPYLDSSSFGPSSEEGYSWGRFFDDLCDGVEVVTPTLNTVGEITYYATVTDRRGRTSDPVSVTINVVDYNEPVIARSIGERCDSSGNPQEDGDNIVCYYEASYPNVSGNTGSFNLKVYEGLDNTGTLVETKSLSREGNVAKGQILLTNKPNHKDYFLELVAKDNNVTITRGTEVYSTNAVLDITPRGGVAVGKIAKNYYYPDLSSSTSVPTFEVNLLQVNYNNLIPDESNKFDLGNNSKKWRTLYAVNCTCCSDASFKENISYVSNSNKERTSGQISQEDLHNFYKSDYQLATYNYIGQEQQEYGFVTSDMYDNSVGESLITRNDNGDYFSINSYISTIAGALQYEINLRDEQIATLNQMILEMQEEIKNLKQGD